MRRLLLVPALSICVFAAEKVDLEAVHKIREEAFNNSKVMDHAFQLTDVHGPRLTGSPGYKAAAEWAVKQLTSMGFTAKLEKWGPFGRGWVNTRFSAHMTEPTYMPLIGVAREWAAGTNGAVSGQAILATFNTDADFDKWKGKLKGKVVLTAPARDLPEWKDAMAHDYTAQELADMMLAGALTPQQFGRRNTGPGPQRSIEELRAFRVKLNKFLLDEGVLVSVTPSLRTDGGTIFTAAAGSREEKEAVPVASVALTGEHYNRIARLLDKKSPVTLAFDIQSKLLTDEKDSWNVVAELEGTDKKDEWVMLGAHLDSWTYGTGATDNAAGCSVAMESLRVLKESGVKPRRSIRLLLWSGEEQGLLGSRAYVKEHYADREVMDVKPEHGKVSAYFNLDNGTGKVRGIYIQHNDMARPIFDEWLKPFNDLGATAVTIRNTGGTDHLSFDAVGIPGFQFVQDPVEYGTRTHHSNMDVYDRLNKEDLMQASAVMASFVYLASARDDMFPRKPLPKPQPVTGKREDIEFTKAGDVSLTMDAYIPREGAGPFPAVIVVHGGGWINGDKNTYVKPMFDPLTKSGMAWFTINYRLAPAHKYPAAVEDVEAAIRHIRAEAKRYKVDPNRIAIVGESAGGHLVSLVAARGKEKVQAVVSFYGVHDIEARSKSRGEPGENIEKFLGIKGMDEASLKAQREASPVTYVKRGIPPFLMIHGTDDKQVPYDQSPLMCEKIKSVGGACEVFTVQGAPHGVEPWEKNPEWQGYKTKMIDWLKTALAAPAAEAKPQRKRTTD